MSAEIDRVIEQAEDRLSRSYDDVVITVPVFVTDTVLIERFLKDLNSHLTLRRVTDNLYFRESVDGLTRKFEVAEWEPTTKLAKMVSLTSADTRLLRGLVTDPSLRKIKRAAGKGLMWGVNRVVKAHQERLEDISVK